MTNSSVKVTGSSRPRDFVSRKVNRLTSPCRLNPDKTSGMQHFILVNYENRIQVENYYEMNTRDHAI